MTVQNLLSRRITRNLAEILISQCLKLHYLQTIIPNQNIDNILQVLSSQLALIKELKRKLKKSSDLLINPNIPGESIQFFYKLQTKKDVERRLAKVASFIANDESFKLGKDDYEKFKLPKFKFDKHWRVKGKETFKSGFQLISPTKEIITDIKAKVTLKNEITRVSSVSKSKFLIGTTLGELFILDINTLEVSDNKLLSVGGRKGWVRAISQDRFKYTWVGLTHKLVVLDRLYRVVKIIIAAAKVPYLIGFETFFISKRLSLGFWWSSFSQLSALDIRSHKAIYTINNIVERSSERTNGYCLIEKQCVLLTVTPAQMWNTFYVINLKTGQRIKKIILDTASNYGFSTFSIASMSSYIFTGGSSYLSSVQKRSTRRTMGHLRISELTDSLEIVPISIKLCNIGDMYPSNLTNRINYVHPFGFHRGSMLVLIASHETIAICSFSKTKIETLSILKINTSCGTVKGFCFLENKIYCGDGKGDLLEITSSVREDYK